MKIKSLTTLATGLMIFGFSSISLATPIELVVNGEFEDLKFSPAWTHVKNEIVDGWSGTSGQMELWNQGKISSPSFGTDGLETGVHHEVAWNRDDEVTSQDIWILADGLIDFSFDAWSRDATGIKYSLTGSLSGILASGGHTFTSNAWEAISYTGLSVLGGETVYLQFESMEGGSRGAHIDQVSVMYEAAPVPEPATMLLFGTGLAGLMGARLRKKK